MNCQKRLIYCCILTKTILFDDILKCDIVAGRNYAHCHARKLVKVEVSKLEYLIIHE